jgi:formamidopyrimidine-DNA glycosylase
MPELPEAETLVRGLRPHLEGRALTGVEVHHADVLRMPADAFRERIAGRRIRAVRRRAKNIVLDLDTGVVVVNLGMTGWLAPLGEGSALAESVTHPALTFGIEPSNRGAPTDTRRLVFDDIRRFGCVEALSDEEWSARSAQIGPEPLEPEFTAERLWADLRSSRSPVRNWLLDQRRVAGVGNIYASEACWSARVHPGRPCRDITWREARDLHRGMVDVLRAAVDAGGTTIRNYRNVHGERGSFVHRLRVYGREGDPCVDCGVPIERIVLSNRSAFFCPSCQR